MNRFLGLKRFRYLEKKINDKFTEIYCRGKENGEKKKKTSPY